MFMNTNVQQRNDIPAGILSGTEFFTIKKEKRVCAMREGERKDFNELPSEIQQTCLQACLADKAYHKFAERKWGAITFTDVFFHWMDCHQGVLDTTSDIDEITGELVKDQNTWCGDCECEMAGVACSMPYDLKIAEVVTLQHLHSGHKVKQIAPVLYLAESSIVSRVEKLKEKFGAKNTPELVHLTSNLH